MPLEAVSVAEPRLRAPATLAEIVSDGRHDRLAHALGKAYRDVVRGFRGAFEHVPDLIARPRSEPEVAAVLEWCADANAAASSRASTTDIPPR